MKARLIGALALALAVTLPAVGEASGAKNGTTPVSIDVRGASLADVISLLARQSHTNIVIDGSVPPTTVTISLRGVSLNEALEAIESSYGLTEVQRQNYMVLVPTKNAGFFGDATGQVTEQVDIPTGNAVQIASSLQNAIIPGTMASAVDARTLVITGPVNNVSRVKELALTMSGGSRYGMTSVSLKNVLPSDMLLKLQRMRVVPDGAQVLADDPSVQLIIGGSPDFRKSVLSAVSVLDVPVQQVTYFVQVLDVKPIQDSQKRGILWGQPTTTGTGQISISPGSAVTAFANRVLPIGAQINELISSGNARVLASPSVVIPNGGEHILNVGATVPIAVTNGGLVGGTTVQYYQIGVRIDIKAQIGSTGDVTSLINASDSDILSYDPFSHLPIIATRSSDTGKSAIGVRVHDGESIILAGFFSDSQTDILNKIPVLGDVPVIGQLFKERERTHTQDQLVFVVTPHIGTGHPSQQLLQSIMQGQQTP